jgi:predicted DNA-binding transcriptional regulator AlpA
MTTISQPLLLTIEETIALLGGNISRRSIWRWSADGRFPRPVRLAGRTLWKRRDVEDFILQADGSVAKLNRLRRGEP